MNTRLLRPNGLLLTSKANMSSCRASVEADRRSTKARRLSIGIISCCFHVVHHRWRSWTASQSVDHRSRTLIHRVSNYGGLSQLTEEISHQLRMECKRHGSSVSDTHERSDSRRSIGLWSMVSYVKRLAHSPWSSWRCLAWSVRCSLPPHILDGFACHKETGELGRVCWTGGHAHHCSVDRLRPPELRSFDGVRLPSVRNLENTLPNRSGVLAGRQILLYIDTLTLLARPRGPVGFTQDNGRLCVCVVDRCGKKRTSCSGLNWR